MTRPIDAAMLARLPKWAAQHIAILTRDLAHAESLLAVDGNVAETNVRIRRPASLKWEALPRDAEVAFVIPGRNFADGRPARREFAVRVRVSATLSDGHEVNINADGAVMARHASSNHFFVQEAP